MRRAIPCLFLGLFACGPFFWPAPPPLAHYPERQAVKLWQHLVHEAAPPADEAPDARELDREVRALARSLGEIGREAAEREIERLLEANRHGPYAASRANALHEMAEFAADPDLLPLAADYLAWRLSGRMVPPPRPPAFRPWQMAQEDFNVIVEAHRAGVAKILADLDARANDAPPPLLPHWLVQRGAFHFQMRDFAAADADFRRVLEEFPEHPRAEAATLMLARCLIESARAERRIRGQGAEPALLPHEHQLYDEAESLLRDFVESKPRGRFAPDAHGWLGAIAFDQGDLGLAVSRQLDRLALQASPEVVRSVLRECDQIFERLLGDPPDDVEGPWFWLDPHRYFDAAAVARQPLVARLFVQHALDPAAHLGELRLAENFSSDRGGIEFLRRRIFRPGPLIRAALLHLGEEMTALHSQQDPATLHLLAVASMLGDEPGQAIALLDRVPPESRGDEIAHTRLILLQRLGRHAQALAEGEAFLADFPDSPLATDLPFRLAISRFRSGQAGQAALAFLDLADRQRRFFDEGEPTDASSSALRPSSDPLPYEAVQWSDALLHFAPLDELVAAASAADEAAATPQSLATLRVAIRSRALAEGRLDLVARFLDSEDEAPPFVRDGRYRAHQAASMTEADWQTRVAPLIELHARLNEAPPSARAEIHLAIARHWMARRGFLTLPLGERTGFANSEPEKADLQRRRNARHLGFEHEAVDLALDLRDEASHALRHALLAAEAADPAVAAAALEFANHCLFRRAEISLYQRARALETDASSLSRELHERLLREHPASPEARRSAWLTFTAPVGSWMPGDYNPANSHMAMLQAMSDPGGEPFQDALARQRILALAERLRELDPATPPDAIGRAIEVTRRELEALRVATDPANQSEILAVVDLVDDLAAAASLPGLTTADFIAYANGRYRDLPATFASLIDFRSRADPRRGPRGEDLGPANDTILGWQEFLFLHPDSPKAEAASLRLVRLIARQSRSQIAIEPYFFPDAPIPRGYKRVAVRREQAWADPQEVLQRIADHERDFPQGRYRDDLDLLRAGALTDLGELDEALVHLLSVLSKPSQRDLHGLAILNFSEIAQRLLEPETRGQAIDAFRRNPGSRFWLRRLARGDTFLSRLEPLMPWIESRLR